MPSTTSTSPSTSTSGSPSPFGNRSSQRLQPFTQLGQPRPRLVQFRPFAALREVFRRGYNFSDLRADILAGLVIGVVALPLSMALAIATGVPPQYGLYTAIVAGIVTAVLGGSRVQVSGPTAAFVVILVPIAHQHGIAGLLVATVFAGIILMALGLFGLGRLILFIPNPVVTGFTAGIAVVIATIQLKDVLGLTFEHTPETYVDRVALLVTALPGFRWQEFAVAAVTLAILIGWPRVTRRIPAPLVALSIVGVGVYALSQFTDFRVATILTRFSEQNGIPSVPPTFQWPWDIVLPGEAPLHLDPREVFTLINAAFAIAMLGAIESLLSAVVADGMAGTRHDPDAELFAQGVGNVVAPFFGGFASTGAIARTATNIRSGARSPISVVVHSVFILISIVVLAPVLGHLPMAAMSALLMLVAYNMSEVKHFIHILWVSPAADVAVMLTCFTLTVAYDMVVGVTVGMVLAALMFIRRVTELSGAQLVGAGRDKDYAVPPGIMLYDIGGPMFFGAAQKAMSALNAIHLGTKVVVLDMRDVPAMDATGLVSLESTIDRLYKQGVITLLGGVQPRVMEVLQRAGMQQISGKFEVLPDFDKAMRLATALVEEDRLISGGAAATPTASSSHPPSPVSVAEPPQTATPAGSVTAGLTPVFASHPDRDTLLAARVHIQARPKTMRLPSMLSPNPLQPANAEEKRIGGG